MIGFPIHESIPQDQQLFPFSFKRNFFSDLLDAFPDSAVFLVFSTIWHLFEQYLKEDVGVDHCIFCIPQTVQIICFLLGIVQL